MTDGEHALRTAAAETRARDLALVLASAGIRHRVERQGAGWRLVVAAGDIERAAAALAAYEQEREPRPARMPAEYGRTYAGVVLAGLLLAFYLVTGPAVPPTRWSRAGGASAERIVAGDVWRTVTALTLHADPAHLVGNAVACAVFVTAIARALGPGLGGWLVLLAGAGGNGLNALLHGEHHDAVGASTAIFGAIGLLGGLQSGRKRGERGAWVAVAGSLALLALLGTSPHADILAHLFGLLVGIVLGITAAMAVHHPPGRTVQWLLAASAVLTVVACWVVAVQGW